MSILIPGKMPKDGNILLIDQYGNVRLFRPMEVTATRTGLHIGTAIELPPHGRLGDLDALLQECQKDGAYGYISAFEIDNAPTIIPAEGGDAQ